MIARAETQHQPAARPHRALTPQALGLTAFERFRPAQVDALERIRENRARVMIIQAPTGVGKSGIAAAAGRLLDMQAAYCCTTKGLQRQFCQTFPDAVELMGRVNYPTADGPPTMTCEDCNWKEGRGCSWCRSRDLCPYRLQKEKALAAPFAVLNTAYFLAEVNHGGAFSRPEQLLVVDEADELEGQLLDAVTVKLSEPRLRALGMKLPRLTQTPEAEDWTRWAAEAWETARSEARARRQEAQRLRDTGDQRHVQADRDARGWAGLAMRLGWLAEDLAEKRVSWVRVDDEGGLCFKPVWVGKYAHRLLWTHAERVVLMSATIISPDQFARDLGLKREDWEWMDLPCPFPVARRPIYFRPVASMAQRSRLQSLPDLVAELDRILDGCRERVLVHTHTYAVAREVLARSRHHTRMLTYAGADERDRVLEAFKSASHRDGVLVAPSMERGVDLRDDLCRCVVVLLAPKPYFGDTRVKVRVQDRDGERWKLVHQIRQLCQMTGRGMRGEDDRCDSYILDSEFGGLWFSTAARNLMPGWWREAVVAP